MTPKYFISIALIVIACNGKSADSIAIDQCKNDIVKSSDFQLIKADHQKGLLILFPCFPCDSENTLDEFNIHDLCVKSGFSVLALNFNQRLYLKINEKRELAEEITSIILENDLPIKNIFIGGFSSGGNVSLLLADHLVKTKNQIQPKGVFIVDSPVDLLALYRTSEKNVENNYSPASIEESIWIKQFFDKEFGQPSNGISNYEEFSPYTFKTQNISNLLGLKHLKIRLYTEPDIKWWKERVGNDYEDLNAFHIENLYDKLKIEFGTTDIELIKTSNKGYRKNGEKHPHSWSIVDKQELINWMSM